MLMKKNGPSFGPILFIFSKANVYHIARYYIFYKNHLAVNPRERFSFSRIIFDKNILQNDIFFSFARRESIAIFLRISFPPA